MELTFYWGDTISTMNNETFRPDGKGLGIVGYATAPTPRGAWVPGQSWSSTLGTIPEREEGEV